MQYLGIEYQMKHAPKLDPTFIPFGVWRAAYLQGATKPLAAVFLFIRLLSTVLPRWQKLTTAM